MQLAPEQREACKAIHLAMARAYVKFLRGLAWDDRLVVAGSREGRTKFLSNAYLSLFPGRLKYAATHYASADAAARMAMTPRRGGLVWEHVVPKQAHIQRPCELAAQDGTLTDEFVADLLDRYWRLATITREEDGLLPRRWQGTEDLAARYLAAGVTLQPNPHFAGTVSLAVKRL